MKKQLIVVIILLMSFFNMYAQNKQDSLEIEKVCKDYVEGWATGDEIRVSSAVSPELFKRTIDEHNGLSFTINMSASQLIYATKRNGKEGVRLKDFEPNQNIKVDVIIYDITGNFAMAKTFNSKYGFFDYCQLAKFNGEWKIFNVLYGMTRILL